MDVEAAVRYPLDSDDAIRTILIGGGLLLLGGIVSIVALILSFLFIGIFLFPLAFVPQVLVQGYLVRVLRSTVRGEAEPPTFDEWGEIAVDGIKFIVVSVLYSLPVVVVGVLAGVVLFGVTVIGFGAAPDQAGATSIGVLLVTAVAGSLIAVLVLAVLYLVPAGLCAMVHEDDLVAAFDLERLRRVGRTRDYAVGWGVAAAVMLVGNAVGNTLTLLLVGFPILFASQVVGFRLFALGYVDALDLDTGGSTPSDTTGDAPTPPSAGAVDTTGGSGDDDRDTTPTQSSETRPTQPSESTDGTTTDE